MISGQHIGQLDLPRSDNAWRSAVVIEDDPGMHKLLTQLLRQIELLPLSAASACQADELLAKTDAAIVLLDLGLPDRLEVMPGTEKSLVGGGPSRIRPLATCREVDVITSMEPQLLFALLAS